jgi:hypothetical protein
MGQSILKLVLQVFGIALVVSGVLWALQGLGIVMWPAGSFMLADRSWALYGGLAAGIGCVAFLIASRLGPPS